MKHSLTFLKRILEFLFTLLIGFLLLSIKTFSQSNLQAFLTHFGGKGDDILNQLVISNKNLYLVGSFCDTISFGTSRLGTYGYFDGFLAKADSEGNIPG